MKEKEINQPGDGVCYLSVFIRQAKGLPKMDTFGAGDPYVKVRVFPKGVKEVKGGDNIIRQTRRCNNTHTPVFNERLDFELTADRPELFCLQLDMFDFDKMSSDDFYGTISIDLKTHFTKGLLKVEYMLMVGFDEREERN